MTNPLKQVLSETLGDQVAVFDYSSAVDFEVLWRLDSIKASQVVVVWSQTANDDSLGPVNSSDCLTPVDWAICCAARRKNDAGPWPNVLILDLCPALHKRIPSIVRLNSLKPDLFPWLRFDQHVNLETITEWFANPQVQDHALPLFALKRFLGDIRSALTESHGQGGVDHHAIANIIAPLILLGREVTSSPHRVALKTLLKSCELIGSSGALKCEEGPETHAVSSQVKQSEFTDVHVLLVDDQEHHGWSDWVREVLPGVNLTSFRDPKELVNVIKMQLDAAPDTRDLRFKLNLPGVAEGALPIVLLDLRLFSGNIAGEKAFYKDMLLPLMEKYFTDKPELAWGSFSSEDDKYSRAKEMVEKFVPESDEHHQAITWLPRVLALSDMSLPIVLFSSTDRRQNVTPLLPYRNIFLSFQKPAISALADPLLRPTVRVRFLETMRMAVAYGELRKKCISIKQLAETVKFNSEAALASSDGRLHIELYVDESGTSDKSKFCVGGVFGVFGSIADADSFDDVCVSKGLRYFRDTLFEPSSPNPLDKNNDKGVQQLKVALQEFRGTQGKHVALGFIRLLRGAIRDNENLKDNNEDERLHRLLSALVEVFCAESVPAIAAQYGVQLKNISLSVYLGTRVVECPLVMGHFTYRGNIEIYNMGSGRMLRSMGGRDAFPIVRAAFSQHPNLSPLVVERALAVCMPYEGSKKPRFDQVIHRPTKTVYKFDHYRDVLPNIVMVPGIAYGIVSRVTVEKGFLHVTVSGLERDVFCHCSNCFFQLKNINSGDFVKLNIEANNKGFSGSKVSIVTREEAVNWLETLQPVVSSEFLRGQSLKDYRPDYRSLHYSADQILVWDAEHVFDKDIPRCGVAGQFDEYCDQALESGILASRALDAGLLADSLAVCNADPVNVHALRPSARAYLASRLWSQLLTCKGDVLSGAFPLQAVYCNVDKVQIRQNNHVQARVNEHMQLSRGEMFSVSKQGQGSGEAVVDEIQKKWRVKHCGTTKEFLDSGEFKTTPSGLQVRRVANNQIVVFADLTYVQEEQLVGFDIPDESLFRKGKPSGKLYTFNELFQLDENHATFHSR